MTSLNVSQEAPPPVIPDPSPHWTPTALMAWEAFLANPASQYAEGTDYVAAQYLCDLISETQRTGYRAGQVQMVRQLMVDLLFMESARRAVNIEINRTPEVEDPARVSALEIARNRRAGRA